MTTMSEDRLRVLLADVEPHPLPPSLAAHVILDAGRRRTRRRWVMALSSAAAVTAITVAGILVAQRGTVPPTPATPLPTAVSSSSAPSLSGSPSPSPSVTSLPSERPTPPPTSARPPSAATLALPHDGDDRYRAQRDLSGASLCQAPLEPQLADADYRAIERSSEGTYLNEVAAVFDSVAAADAFIGWLGSRATDCATRDPHSTGVRAPVSGPWDSGLAVSTAVLSTSDGVIFSRPWRGGSVLLAVRTGRVVMLSFEAREDAYLERLTIHARTLSRLAGELAAVVPAQ